MIKLADTRFNFNGHWSKPIDKTLFTPLPSDLELFDQNGYDLTELEQRYAEVNDARPQRHRQHRAAIKQPWFTQEDKLEGAVLNHSLLFERKAYSEQALEQLQRWAQRLPLIYKIIAMRPKWGLDFSIDYVDRQGNAFEVLHWEWDGFSYEEVEAVRQQIEPKLAAIDWDDAALQILEHKDKWHHLDFFAQSDWKCNYFGIPKERFKMVAWE
jgi:hypothetical protein